MGADDNDIMLSRFASVFTNNIAADAKLNATKAIVAERLVTALERIQHYKIGKLTDTHAVGAMQEVATAALTAWCELSGN